MSISTINFELDHFVYAVVDLKDVYVMRVSNSSLNLELLLILDDSDFISARGEFLSNIFNRILMEIIH